MYSDAYFFDSIYGDTLDLLLEKGMFRNGRTIFTTQFLKNEEEINDAIWLRINLDQFAPSETQHKLLKQNQRFTIKGGICELNEEKEKLFLQYKATNTFIQSPSLHFLLNDNASNKVYQSFEVCIYDQESLVGYGVYDVGNIAAAGITTIYHPHFKKYSMGMFIILVKMLLNKEAGIKYFYPGYFSPGNRRFDYKLKLAKAGMEFFATPSNTWKDIHLFQKEDSPLQTMLLKLSFAHKTLQKTGVGNELLQYYYYDSNINSNYEPFLPFTYPYFIRFKSNKNLSKHHALVYDLYQQSYMILKVKSYFRINQIQPKIGIYNQNLLIIDEQETEEFKDVFEIAKWCLDY